MDAASLRALEFDQIAAVVRSYAVTPMGAFRLDHLEPSGDRRRVDEMLDLTGEAMLLLQDHPGLPLRAGDELESTLAALAVEGRPLEPLRLLGLADFLESIDRSRHLVEQTLGGRGPRLVALVGGSASFVEETADVRRKIGPHGDVLDSASPALAAVRDKLRRQRQRLRGTLESYLRGRDTAKYLQDLVVTERNGRFVLIVKSEHRNAIPGLVHGSSASGASLYLEPLSTVEVNNEIVALEEQEAEEVRRILLALTDRFRGRAADFQRTLDVATDLDVVQAKARTSMTVKGIRPQAAVDGRLELRHARHPLLMPAVTRRLPDADERVVRDTEPVPIDVLVIPPATALVVTGPNTGGKTVAIKTAGLLALMAQAGLFIPVENGSVLPTFRAVFADIGDEQSIGANLSTFSGHIAHIVAMDRALSRPALVLLDEVGNGTDPVEGGALGVAIIDHFRQRGAVVIATTHFETIKSYATSTPGVACAAFGFEPETFAPTYRLLYGSPGASLAFEMAARLGMPGSVLEAARQWRTEKDAKLVDQLARMDRDLQALDHERRLATRARTQAEEAERQWRVRDDALRERESQFGRKLEQRLNEQLRTARAEVDRIVDDLKQQAARLAKQPQRHAAPLSTGDTGQLRGSARDALDLIAQHVREGGLPEPSAPASPVVAGPIHQGDRVEVGPLRLPGIVRAIGGRDAEIDVNGKRMRARVADLRKVGGPVQAARPAVTVVARTGSDIGPQGGGDLNVIGCTVDEAIDRADKFLDEAIMQERRTVRVIHGHGTGRLRQALSGYLGRHPLVVRHAPAPNDQGGSAITVVELKE
jgi:DNA mismatch repair protein MutS2